MSGVHQRTLEHFVKNYDVAKFVQRDYQKSTTQFCEYVNMEFCVCCCWAEVCDTVKTGEMAETLDKKYAEYLI